MVEVERYKHLNNFLKNKFGERTLKICIDGNFTCPNRDGTKGTGGCIFCSEKGSGDHIKKENTIKKQVEDYFNSYKSQRANKFIIYFQNFTNTYDSIENLKLKYDEAMCDKRIVALAVATRPDCINEDIAKLLSTYASKYYVWVELGLQSANDFIGEKINRKYNTMDFSNAVKILRKYNIDIVSHIMVGLPGEEIKDIYETVDFLNNQNIQGIKIHSCYIVKNTVLEQMYKNGEYTPITLEYYLNVLKIILTHINPNFIIHRISGDAPESLLIAPEWNIHKKWVINGIDKIMKEENLYQGMYFKGNLNIEK